MSKKKTPKGQPLKIDPDDAADIRESAAKAVGATRIDHLNAVLSDQAIGSLWTGNSDREEVQRQVNAMAATLKGIGARDELEGLMAVQLVAAHNAAMECYRRAMFSKQTFEGRKENLSQANKLSRTYVTLLEALERRRGSASLRPTVEQVHVHAGGQAIVGTVTRSPTGDSPRLEGRPHAEAISHVTGPALQGADAQGHPLPVASDAERAMPNARRHLAGSAKGK